MMQKEEKPLNKALDDLLNQVSWKVLNELIHNLPSTRKNLSRGGFRIQQKNRKRIIPVIREKFAENKIIQYQLFVSWFNEQKQYYDCLKPFFSSDEHEKLLEERNIDKKYYVINDKYFDKFIEIIKYNDIDKFLLLSPVKFTAQQKEMLEKLQFEKNRTASEAEDVNETDHREPEKIKHGDGIFLTKGEWKHHQKEIQKYLKNIEKLEKENQKLHHKLKDRSIIRTACEQKLVDSEMKHAEEVNHLTKENEDLRKHIFQMEKNCSKFRMQLAEKDINIKNLEKKIISLQEENDRHFHRILSRIDAETLIEEINAPNDVIDLLSTVIRRPATDSIGGSAGMEITLEDLWKKMIDTEEALVAPVLKISSEDVVNENYYREWGQHVDNFNDLKCSLSARLYLIKMFSEILRLYYKGN